MPWIFGGSGSVSPTPSTFPTGGSGGGTSGGGGTNWNQIIASALGIGGGLLGSYLGSSGQRDASKSQKELAAEELAIRKQILGLIVPFATQLMQLGIDPAKFISSPLGQSLLRPGREAIGKEFEQARTNLVDASSGRGFSPGSGQAIGPMANLFGQEATAQSSLVSQLPQQGLQLGLQGIGALTGVNPSGSSISNIIQAGGQPNLFQQGLSNIPAAIGGAINNYQQQQLWQQILNQMGNR